jgi:hypothetical protein
MLAGRERCARLRVISAEARGKPPAFCGLQGGRSGGPRLRRLRPKALQARLITLLHALLPLELAVLCLQQSLLCTLGPRAFRLLRLQLLHALLQPIDAGLAIRALARQRLALPLLHDLLSLLDALITRLRARLDLFLSRRPRRDCRRCAGS